jgi:hypothetical protein
MPGLLRGMARTAVVAGTATAVSNRVSRRQAQRWSNEPGGVYGQEPQQQYAEPQYAQPQQYAAPPPEPEEDPIAQLRELAKLRDDGILTEEEFAAEKAKILR